jgi:hypothetical protein
MLAIKKPEGSVFSLYNNKSVHVSGAGLVERLIYTIPDLGAISLLCGVTGVGLCHHACEMVALYWASHLHFQAGKQCKEKIGKWMSYVL